MFEEFPLKIFINILSLLNFLSIRFFQFINLMVSRMNKGNAKTAGLYDMLNIIEDFLTIVLKTLLTEKKITTGT